MVYMSKTGDKWVVLQDIQNGQKVLFSADNFDAVWDAWVSYQK
jgi:hypothetical protein